MNGYAQRWVSSCRGAAPWRWAVLAFGAGLGLAACSGAHRGSIDATGDGSRGKVSLGPTPHSTETPDATPTGIAETEVALPARPIAKGSLREHPAKVAWAFDGDPKAPKSIELDRAEEDGYTLIDLSDGWTPYIFSEKTPGLDDTKLNRYRKTYLGLASDTVDSEGDPLRPWNHNYLELYGISPSLSVVYDGLEHVRAEVEPCLEAAGFDPAVFHGFTRSVEYRKNTRTARTTAAARQWSKLSRAMQRAKLDPSKPEDIDLAAENPSTVDLHKKWRTYQDEIDVIDHAQRRFRCERLFNGQKGAGTFEAGVFDTETTHALANFERMHDIMGWGHFDAESVAVLAISPRDAAYQRLRRVLQERVVSAAGILEDGSAAKWKPEFRYADGTGTERALRDLVTEFTDRAISALGLDDPASLEEQFTFLSTLGTGGFDDLLVAIKMPELPPYYGSNMAFETTIDRGDVWYDFPYDEEGNPLQQRRQRFPHLTLYVRFNEQLIPLVHWRTTIGSWRNELQEGGELMLKYKNSDVGSRVWKDILAAPVWIPPTTTPTPELIKSRWRNGKFVRDVNYDEIGPGYRSAYGLVAAYHIKQHKDAEGNVLSEFDNSIRTHGSVDYMSILRRFSHGCHRLYNMDAVRLFSFILLHRDYLRQGQQNVGVRRELLHEEQTYELKIDTRGYKYELATPIPVYVTEGRIRGRQKTPIEEYVPKPTKAEDGTLPVELDDGQGGTITVPFPIPPTAVPMPIPPTPLIDGVPSPAAP